jgi:hypothetical protein
VDGDRDGASRKRCPSQQQYQQHRQTEDYRIGQVIAKGSFGADIRHGLYNKKDKDEQRSSSKKSSSKKSPKSSYLHVSIKCVSNPRNAHDRTGWRWYKNKNSYVA